MKPWFHLWFVAVFLLLLALRLYYHSLSRTWERQRAQAEGRWMLLLRFGLGLPMLGATLLYLVRPGLFSWASVELPESWRWLGGVLSSACLPLAWWIHRALGKNFSSDLRIRSDHTLVTAGPYRYVRHPMYSTFLLCFTGMLLLTANWFLAGVGWVVLVLVMILRTPQEERLMIEAFGDQYRDYMARTGRFLPRLWSS